MPETCFPLRARLIGRQTLGERRCNWWWSRWCPIANLEHKQWASLRLRMPAVCLHSIPSVLEVPPFWIIPYLHFHRNSSTATLLYNASESLASFQRPSRLIPGGWVCIAAFIEAGNELAPLDRACVPTVLCTVPDAPSSDALPHPTYPEHAL